MSMAPPIKLAYLVSHPIQYQAPLLRRIAADPDIDLTVFFCSAYSVREHRDAGFGRMIQWDVPLLDGYAHRFLPALGDTGPPTEFRPLNYGLARLLREGGYQVLWAHGYTRLYNLISMYLAHRRGMIVVNRDDVWSGSFPRGPTKRAAKRVFFAALRRICDGWLAVGSANRDYFLEQGMAPDSVFFVPYAVDNDRFRTMAADAAATRDALRMELTLERGRPVILFAAKFQARKRCADLIEAFARIQDDPACRAPYLVLVGDGEEHEALARQVAGHGLDNVRFAGFRNQTELPRFFDLCDVFVLPSSTNETWGLVINEAMNAGRAVIASDMVGASFDLVRDGENGAVFPAGDVAALAGALRRILSDPALCRRMGERSAEIVADWSFEADVAALKEALRRLLPSGGAA
jgi:glycosyltransferase involved in cell wall biosynthesis